jgi:RNA polymerase sigma-B factor
MVQKDRDYGNAFASGNNACLLSSGTNDMDSVGRGVMTSTAPERLKVRISDEAAKLAPTVRNLEALSFLYAQTRSPEIRTALILSHQKLVYYTAYRFVGCGETLDDLIQVGCIGLIHAVDRFDPGRDVKFSSYAVPTIVGEIKRHFRDKTWHIKVPRPLQEMSLYARSAELALSIRLGRAPTVPEISGELDTSEEETLQALEISHIANTLSLDMQLDAYDGADSATLMDVIGHVDSAIHTIAAYADLQRALKLLDTLERDIIHLHFYEELSQAKIARQLGLSQMQVSRLQKRALQRLRGILAGAFAGLPSPR